jgi:hypothetical protein
MINANDLCQILTPETSKRLPQPQTVGSSTAGHVPIAAFACWEDGVVMLPGDHHILGETLAAIRNSRRIFDSVEPKCVQSLGAVDHTAAVSESGH